MSKNDFLLVLVLGIFLGASFMSTTQFSESTIPPTAALRDIFVQTSQWFATDTPVVATNSSDRVYFVTDGSIIFNVTESYP